MNLQDILYVIEVADTGSFSKASENLYVTEPTISQRIKRLENELHVALFSRTTRKVTITEAGKTFLQYASPIAENYRSLTTAMRCLSRESQKALSIGMMTNMYTAGIPQFFRNFCMSHPELDVHLHTMSYRELHDSLCKDALDYAILKIHKNSMHFFNPQKFTYDLLRKEQLYVLFNEDAAPKNISKLRIPDISHLPVIVDDEAGLMYQMLFGLYQQAGLQMPLSSIRTGDAETVMLGIEHGDGISFGSDSIISYYKNRFHFVAIPLAPSVEYNLYLISCKENKHTSFDRDFIRNLKIWLNNQLLQGSLI